MQTRDGLQALRDTPPGGSTPVPDSASRAQADVSNQTKPVLQPRGKKTGTQPGRLSAHSVFVLAWDGTPLTPTTPAKARKLLKHGGVKKVWSKFGTFGIQILYEVGRTTPRTALGVDHGTKFEGYSVVTDKENSLNIKLDLPDKKKIIKKVEQRRTLRRARRFRNCRRRPCRSDNRGKKDFTAPSQKVIVDSRLKILIELYRIYPITVAGVENVCFSHFKYRWGANFSTMEIGKTKIRQFFEAFCINVTEFKGYETSELRKVYGYKKTRDKSEDRFESHCSDSLTLACAVSTGRYVEPGPFLTVDDTYRCVRRQLHDTQPARGGVRDLYSTGTVAGLRKGLLIGTRRGPGRFCGMTNGKFRYYDQGGKRQVTKSLSWVSSSFMTRTGSGDSPTTPTEAGGPVDRLWDLLGEPTIDPVDLERQVRMVAGFSDLDYRTVRLLYQVSLDLLAVQGDVEFQRKIVTHCQFVGLDTKDDKFTTLKHRLKPTMNVNTIKQYLRDLGSQMILEEEIIIGGSCAISLQGLPFRTTDDMDVVDEIPVGIRTQQDLINQLSMSYGLRLTHFQSHYLPDGWLNRVSFLGKFGNLQVFLVDVYDIIAGKFFSLRTKDRDDLRRLVPVLDKDKILYRIHHFAQSILSNLKYHENLLKNWYVVYGEQFEPL
jgi:hypothetical protein